MYTAIPFYLYYFLFFLNFRLARMFPIQFFAMRTAKLSAPVLLARNEYKFMTFITSELTQNFIADDILRNRSCPIIINFFMMYFPTADTAIKLIISARFKNLMTHRTYFLHTYHNSCFLFGYHRLKALSVFQNF